jgi:hypothetical protein
VADVADDKLLTHYFRFVVREESGPLRERLQRGLVERALKTGNPTHSMTAVAIRSRVEQLLVVKDYPRELVNQALSQLVPRGHVQADGRTKNGDLLYRLAPTRFQMLDIQLERVEEQERMFGSSVVQKVEASHGVLTDGDKRRIETAFVDLVGMILGKIGESCALNLVEEKHWENASDYPRFQADLEHAVRGLPAQIQEAARTAFEETLRSPTSEERDYLFSIGQVYYMVELLHLDPELQALQRGRFEETTLFLDTNLLLAALLQEHPRHEVVTALLVLCRDLGFDLRYTERTIEEVDVLIDAADQEYRNHPPFDAELAAELADAVENPFLRAYFRSSQATDWSWLQFKMRIAGWREILENQAITLDTKCPRTQTGQRYEHLKRVIGKPPEQTNGVRRRVKRPRAAEHDAHVLTAIEDLIQQDKAEAHPFGHRYWLLTLDRHLADCARKSARSDVGPVCMLAEEWVQYISPFLGPDVSHDAAADVFARLLGSRFFVSLGSGLDLEDLQPFTAPNVREMFEGLSREEACRMVARAAQSDAVAAASPEKRPQVALAKLLGFVDELLRERQSTGELVPREDVERLRQGYAHETQQLAESSQEKDDEIAALRRQVAEKDDALEKAALHVRWSLPYQLGRLRTWAVTRAWSWVRGRWVRLLLATALLVLGVASLVEGWGGQIVSVIILLAAVVAIIAADPDVAKRNVKRAFKAH